MNTSFNPLKIGSYCNETMKAHIPVAKVSIPLKSGHIVINVSDEIGGAEYVSIPLKSGHIVMMSCQRRCKGTFVSIPLKSGHIVIYLATVNRESENL